MKPAVVAPLLLLFSLTITGSAMEIRSDDLCTHSEVLAAPDCEIIQKATEYVAQKEFGSRRQAPLIITIGTYGNDCYRKSKITIKLHEHDASFAQAEQNHHERQRHRLLNFHCENGKERIKVMSRALYEETSPSLSQDKDTWIMSADLPGYSHDKSAAITTITHFSYGSLASDSVRLKRNPDGWNVLDSKELIRFCGIY